MAINYLKRTLVMTLFWVLVTFQIDHSEASPWALPDNLMLRNDIQLLVDSGVINMPITTWPLAWGDIAYNLSKIEKELTPLELSALQRIKEALYEEEIGGLSSSTSLKWVNNPERIIWFNDSAGAKSEIEAATNYLGNRFAMSIHVNNKRGKIVFDESYIAMAIGDYTLSLGSKKNWWGPGWGGSLIQSTNTRPIPSLSFERNFSDPFESKFLSWMGPWNLSTMIGQMDQGTNFFGMRAGFRPRKNLELGLSTSALFCGENRSCGLSGLFETLLDQDITIDVTVPSMQKSGYQLTGIDFRSSHIVRDFPFAAYGQFVGEENSDSMRLVGLETWGSITKSEWLESYRVFVESSSTHCQSYNPKAGCAYHNPLYPNGYWYKGGNIGHSSDGDSNLLILGAIFVGENSQLIKSWLSVGQLNKNSNPLYTLTPKKTDYFNFGLGYEFDLFWFDIPLGSVDVGLGWEKFDIPLGSFDEEVGWENLNSFGKDSRVYIAWSNGVDFNPKKVRDYSEYPEFLEADDDLETISKPLPEQIDEQPSFLALDTNLKIVQVVDLMDQVINQRVTLLDDIKDRRVGIQTLENKSIIDKLNISLPTTVSEHALTELMIMIDQIMQNRN